MGTWRCYRVRSVVHYPVPLLRASGANDVPLVSTAAAPLGQRFGESRLTKCRRFTVTAGEVAQSST